jgi:eukaryotic-like serine/threonine-protein kinase
MTEAAKKWVGQVVDGKFRLGEFVGGNERSAVFLTDFDAPGVRKTAIKLLAADSPEAAGLLARWRHAAELSHPHLIRLLKMGRAQFNDTPILYVVTEYADENLSIVLARRPLGPAETRAILGPVVDALAYIHSKGFVHTRIKPANIMAEEDLLKISSDGLCRIGESGGSFGKPGAYDPPEAAGGRISPAGDVWSLGMTLAEALTQRLPSWERTNQAEAALPSGMPPEFVDLTRHCLRRDPQLRWSVADIAARLQPNAPAQPKQIIPSAQSSFDPRRYTLPALIAILALAAIILGPRFFGHHSPQTPPEASVLAKQPAAQPSAQPAAPAKPDPQLAPNLTRKPAVTPPGPPVAKPAPPIAPPAVAKPTSQAVKQAVSPSAKNSNEKKTAIDSAAAPPAAAHSGAPPAIPSGAGVVRGKVIQQVLPNASQTARNTIRGTVRVSVKVHVDESGSVTQATFDSRGPSQYFADRALQAAQLWKFASPKIDGHNVASDWVIRFEIDPTVIRVFPAETAP